jgi:hypothetical protein
MAPRKLASAYADAVLDYLETGSRQGILPEDDAVLFTEHDEPGASSQPRILVDGRWQELVPGVSVSTNPSDPAFCPIRLRAQIIDDLLVSGRVELLAVGIVAIDAG